MDVSETLIPNSDQLDAADLAASGPRIFTIERVVVKSGAEQPVDVHLAEFPRPWRPGRNMRRVLAHVLGKDSSKWVGHKVELYYDDAVIFGKEKVGGSRISRMTGIDAPIKAPIIIGRGKRGTWPVKPLVDTAAPTELTPTELAAQVATGLADSTTDAEVREWGNRAHARNLLDISPAGSTGTLRDMVAARLADIAAQTGADS